MGRSRDVPYAHAKPGEHCAKCNDTATRVVGTRPLCVDHFVYMTPSPQWTNA